VTTAVKLLGTLAAEAEKVAELAPLDAVTVAGTVK
jgi:hypothetical protein